MLAFPAAIFYRYWIRSEVSFWQLTNAEERMRWLSVGVLFLISTIALAQTTYTDLPSYCRDMSEASTPTLLVRTRGFARAQAEALMEGMTDPVAIRMVKEVIDFAWKRPATTSLDALRAEADSSSQRIIE
jgi:hypothetical protein